MAKRHEKGFADWLPGITRGIALADQARRQLLPPLPDVTPGFVLLPALDIAMALVAYRLSYIARSVSTFGFFESTISATAFDRAPHAPLLIIAFQAVAVWLSGGYRPGLHVLNWSFVTRLAIASLGQSVVLAALYHPLLGKAAYPSIFATYLPLNVILLLSSRLIKMSIQALHQGGTALLLQLPHLLPQYLPQRARRWPKVAASVDQGEHLAQAVHILDQMETLNRNRSKLKTRTDAPGALVERLSAEYGRREAQLRFQLGLALGGLREQGRRAMRNTDELRQEMVRLETEGVELRLRNEIGELEDTEYHQREAERFAAVEACQNQITTWRTTINALQRILSRAWTAAPELTLRLVPAMSRPGPIESELMSEETVEAWLLGTHDDALLMGQVIHHLRTNVGAALVVGSQLLLVVFVILLNALVQKVAEAVVDVAYLLLGAAVAVNLFQVLREAPASDTEHIEPLPVKPGQPSKRVLRWIAPWRTREKTKLAARRLPIPGITGEHITAGPTVTGFTGQVPRWAVVLTTAGVLTAVIFGVSVVRGRAPSPNSVKLGSASATFAQGSDASSQLSALNIIRPVVPRRAAPESQSTSRSIPTATPRPAPSPAPAVGADQRPEPNANAWPVSPSLGGATFSPVAQPASPALSGTPKRSSVPAATTAATERSDVRPAPSLLSPDPGATLGGPVTLLWFWPASLGEREFFELRAWWAGKAMGVIQRTKDSYFVWAPPSSGAYNWQVAVVHSEGRATSESGLPSPIRQFVWVGK